MAFILGLNNGNGSRTIYICFVRFWSQVICGDKSCHNHDIMHNSVIIIVFSNKLACQNKLSRGQICVANFIPPANGASQGIYFLAKV